MKIIKIYSALVLFSVLFLSANAFLLRQSDSGEVTNKDILKFSHEYHSDMAECTDCHSSVTKSISLTDRLLPDHSNCEECHDVDDDEECETCHYEDVYEPLVQTKSGLIFNHQFHLENNDFSCEDCHNGLTEVDYSFESEGKSPQMQICSSCHNETKIASNACESCHISTSNLLPQNHRSANYMRAHKYLAWAGDSDCAMCHDNSTCQECHVATIGITEKNTADDFYQPYMPGNGIDGPAQQIILRAHADLNYRYSHGIDAKGRTSDCQTCHQIETFCANCHQSENTDFALSGIVPASHLLPNFKTIGVGSGGGEHSVLARRDIESCTACHDVQGADPTCVLCHLDSDGIKGTNPKTHVSNFMRNEKGDWHESMGSVCYNCHTSASPNSQQTDGFCNYCHGL